MLTERVSNFTINIRVRESGIGRKDVMHLFLCFLKVSRQMFTLDTFGHQADEYMAPEVMFFMFFVYLCLPMNRVSVRWSKTTTGIII
jgi:hypothetical protein